MSSQVISVQENTQNEIDEFEILLSSLNVSYENKNYNSVLSIFEQIRTSDTFNETCIVNLNSTYLIYSCAFVANIMLLEYRDALKVISEFYNLYVAIGKFYKFLLKERHKEKEEDANSKTTIVDVINKIKSEFEVFNKENCIEFYANLAYAYYKNRQYLEAYSCYNRAIFKAEKLGRDTESKIELYVGEAQSLYCYYDKDLKSASITDTINDYITKIRSCGDSIKVLFALGKLYHFCKESDKAINYIELALEKINSNEAEHIDYKIYAYDWLSRIAYSLKRYSTAHKFYDKLISLMIEDKGNQVKDELSDNVIYPKPILADMVKYLNETNDFLAKKEASYIYQSIYIGIVAGCLLETAEIYAGNSKNLPIIFIMLVVVFVVCFLLHMFWKTN